MSFPNYPKNTRLRNARLARGLSAERLADLLNRTACDLGGRFKGIRINPRSIVRWESGERWPWAINQDLLCHFFNAEPEELGLVRRRDFLLTVTSSLIGESLTASWRDQCTTAASAREAKAAQELDVEGFPLEDWGQLDISVSRLALAYLTQPLLPLVFEMQQMCNSALALVCSAQHAATGKDHLVIFARLCGMLASASCDLGYYDSAEAHARTAWNFASMAGDNELRAWVLATQSLIAFWDGRRQEAVLHAARGRKYAEQGLELVRLASLEARARARLGDHQGVDEAVAVAARAREAVNAPTSPGMFDFPVANQKRCAGSAYLWLGDAPNALQELRGALDLYQDDNAANQSYAHIAVTRLDLAAAYLEVGMLEAAVETVQPVLDLSPPLRLSGIVRRSRSLRPLINVPRYRGSPSARQLDLLIGDFCSVGATRIEAQP